MLKNLLIFNSFYISVSTIGVLKLVNFFKSAINIKISISICKKKFDFFLIVFPLIIDHLSKYTKLR